jgi:hypothetical protein
MKDVQGRRLVWVTMDKESVQPSFQLPAMRLPPFGELAAAARQCVLLQAVRQMAEWTGERRVTKAGNLLLADARVAVRDLELRDHPQARSAAGFPELQNLWSYAQDMNLIEVADGRAKGRAGDTDGEVVEAWIDLLAMIIKLTGGSDGDQMSLAFLLQLYVEPRGITVEALAEHVFTVTLASARGAAGPELNTFDPGLRNSLTSIIGSQVGALRAIDGIVVDGDLARLTDLGRFGMVHWFESDGIGAPFVMDLADATVPQIVDLGLFDESAFDEWLMAVGQDVAAERILDHARGGTPGHRVTAFGMLHQVGAVAEKGVRACLDDADLRPHAHAWLSERGLPAGQASLDDLHRVFIDMVAADLESGHLSERESIRAFADAASYDPAALFENLWRCEHPDTLRVLEALAEHHRDEAAAEVARKGVVSLRSRPGASADAPGDSTGQPRA